MPVMVLAMGDMLLPGEPVANLLGGRSRWIELALAIYFAVAIGASIDCGPQAIIIKNGSRMPPIGIATLITPKTVPDISS